MPGNVLAQDLVGLAVVASRLASSSVARAASTRGVELPGCEYFAQVLPVWNSGKITPSASWQAQDQRADREAAGILRRRPGGGAGRSAWSSMTIFTFRPTSLSICWIAWTIALVVGRRGQEVELGALRAGFLHQRLGLAPGS